MLIGHVCSTFLTAHPVQDVFQFMHTSNDITVKDAASKLLNGDYNTYDAGQNLKSSSVPFLYSEQLVKATYAPATCTYKQYQHEVFATLLSKSPPERKAIYCYSN